MRRVVGEIEIAVCLAGGHHRGIGAKPLTKLDPCVQDIPHVRIGRVGKNASVAERPRTNFRPATQNGDHRPAGNAICDQLNEILLIICLGRQTLVGQGRGQFLIAYRQHPDTG